MTVGELIKQLEQYDPNTPVHFSYDYGDHWHTRVAPEVRHVEDSRVEHSEYHRMDALVDDESKNYDEAKEVVVLL